MPGLWDLAAQLQALAAGTLTREALDAWLAPVLAADPLDVAESDAEPWRDAPEEERLYWRLIHLIDSDEAGDDDALRALAARLVACLASTASAADTLELLPLVLDAPRLCEIVARHARGVVSRTGLLSVIANAGYPPHVKLWLAHAAPTALEALCARLADGAWGDAARLLERAPAPRVG